MANKPIKTQIENLAKKIEKAMKQTFSEKNLNELGATTLKDIVTRTRLGYGFDNIGEPKKKLAPLSNSYKDFRKGKVAFYTDQLGRLRKYIPKQKPKLDPTTTPTKSNLTFSGNMLRSIKYTRKGLSLIFSASGKDNSDKVFFAHEGAPNREKRKFLGITDQEIKKIRNRIEKIYSENLKKIVGG